MEEEGSEPSASAAERNYPPALVRFVARRHILNFNSLALTKKLVFLNVNPLTLAFAKPAASLSRCALTRVTDRRNRAGDDRLNEATQSSPETQFRMFSRMRFFA